jgi:hypothetical protein
LESSDHDARLLSGIKTTVIAVESSLSDIERQSATSAHIAGIESADKLVSPRYFEDAMLVSPFRAQDVSCDWCGISNGLLGDAAGDDLVVNLGLPVGYLAFSGW